MSRRKILVTNDDGIYANGIQFLVKTLSEKNDVYVVAPSSQKSAKSMALTMCQNMDAEEIEMQGAVRAYAFDGTPADCVKWAFMNFSKEGIKFDNLMSGINQGENAGDAVYYSGTIAAAMEGAINGIKSIALSVENHEATEFGAICGVLEDMIKISEKFTCDTVLSVNSPELKIDEIKGIKKAVLTPHCYGETFEFTKVCENTYIQKTVYNPGEPDNDYDYDLIKKGYITVTPLTVNRIDKKAFEKLNIL